MGRVVHIELPAENPKRALAFYKAALGWGITKWEGPMDYWLVSTGQQDAPGIDGAIMRREGPGAVERCTVDVESLDNTIAAITAAGGKIILPKTPVPGVGWLVYFEDTEGNVLGAMQADSNASFQD